MDWISLILGTVIGLFVSQAIVVYSEKRENRKVPRGTVCNTVWPDKDFTGVFAVADDTPWLQAVHHVIEDVERECIEGSRRYTANTNQCIAAVGAGEGASLVRLRLVEIRNIALKQAQPREKNA